MKEITIKAPKEVLKVNIGDESYSIPLGSSLPYKEVMELSKLKGNDQIKFMDDFISKYLGKEVVEKLTMGEMTQIFNAWSEATKEASGATPGES